MEMKTTILVIDDDPSEVKMITMALQRGPYEVISAPNGREGIERARKEDPDLIILDIMMPEKDGVTTCKELKTDPKCFDIPIIILTAIGDGPLLIPEMLTVSGSPCAEDFIEKPVDPNFLVERVRTLIRKQ
jgi:two-component system, OmpR family, alkaline phosphatase synthesis response regulator PhoP